ncbi:MAG TPA: hypothetical protein VFH47_09175, partial [Candidatus Thermoplasmatota archaeon]|nr:hypothetical protein [Candidatus Thermoplasmatota archaeon]
MDRAFPLPEPAGGARGPRPTAAASAGTAEGHVGAGDAPPEIPGTRSAPPAAASAAPAAPEAASSGARDGDRLLLFEPATGHRFLLHADGRGARKERGLGVVDPARFVGHAWGTGHRV